MTTIATAAGPNFASLQQGMNAAYLALTASVMGSYLRPLSAPPFATAVLPNCWNIGLGCVGQPPAWSATVGTGGRGSVDLGDGYRLELNENNSEITIFNDNTGERTRIWGDPHVEIDGQHAYDFWGTTTFTLENGTKLTINTEQWGGNPNAYVASQVVITRGNQAMTIDGISQNQLGDLSITLGQNGRALDAAHRDGYTLHENACGAGWRTDLGAIATQEDLDATRVGREYGPGSQLPNLEEFADVFAAFFLFGTLPSFTMQALFETRERSQA
jgi:hypothetical protein